MHYSWPLARSKDHWRMLSRTFLHHAYTQTLIGVHEAELNQGWRCQSCLPVRQFCYFNGKSWSLLRHEPQEAQDELVLIMRKLYRWAPDKSYNSRALVNRMSLRNHRNMVWRLGPHLLSQLMFQQGSWTSQCSRDTVLLQSGFGQVWREVSGKVFWSVQASS
jgi:hypothetical protein